MQDQFVPFHIHHAPLPEEADQHERNRLAAEKVKRRKEERKKRRQDFKERKRKRAQRWKAGEPNVSTDNNFDEDSDDDDNSNDDEAEDDDDDDDGVAWDELETEDDEGPAAPTPTSVASGPSPSSSQAQGSEGGSESIPGPLVVQEAGGVRRLVPIMVSRSLAPSPARGAGAASTLGAAVPHPSGGDEAALGWGGPTPKCVRVVTNNR